MSKFIWALVITLLAATVSAEGSEYRLVIKDQRFSPAEIHVPANSLFWLLIENKDSSSEEFESRDLHREKLIAGGKTARIKVGPLKPGSYTFFGSFNPATARGVVVAK